MAFSHPKPIRTASQRKTPSDSTLLASSIGSRVMVSAPVTVLTIMIMISAVVVSPGNFPRHFEFKFHSDNHLTRTIDSDSEPLKSTVTTVSGFVNYYSEAQNHSCVDAKRIRMESKENVSGKLFETSGEGFDDSFKSVNHKEDKEQVLVKKPSIAQKQGGPRIAQNIAEKVTGKRREKTVQYKKKKHAHRRIDRTENNQIDINKSRQTAIGTLNQQMQNLALAPETSRVVF
jgi:hypothetical protein